MNNPVAETILAQLGGDRFIVMTGARDFTKGDRCFNFKLPRGAKDGINQVSVVLDANDTYTMTFRAIRNLKFRTVVERDMVYADSLRTVFEFNTGLRCSL